LASNFQGLSTTKRHARANGINAGADGNDVGGIVGGIDEDLFGMFVPHWNICTVRRIPSMNV